MQIRILSDPEQIKNDLRSQLRRWENHLEHDLKTLSTIRDRNLATARFQGQKEAIEYAIEAIEDYQNSKEICKPH